MHPTLLLILLFACSPTGPWNRAEALAALGASDETTRMEGRDWLLLHEDKSAFSDPAVLDTLHAELHRGSAPTRAAILTLLVSSYDPATLGHLREESEALEDSAESDLAQALETNAATLCDAHLRRQTVPEQDVAWCCHLATASDMQHQCRPPAKEPTDVPD